MSTRGHWWDVLGLSFFLEWRTTIIIRVLVKSHLTLDADPILMTPPFTETSAPPLPSLGIINSYSYCNNCYGRENCCGASGGASGCDPTTCGSCRYASGSNCNSCQSGKYKSGSSTATSCNAQGELNSGYYKKMHAQLKVFLNLEALDGWRSFRTYITEPLIRVSKNGLFIS